MVQASPPDISKEPIRRLDVRLSPYVSKSPKDSQKIENELRDILIGDQLREQMLLGRVFSGFTEPDITFIPSFKYDKGADKFDSSPKYRSPAWTDRILYSTYKHQNSESNKARVKPFNPVCLNVYEYSCLDSRHSDHRPVYAKFQMTLN